MLSESNTFVLENVYFVLLVNFFFKIRSKIQNVKIKHILFDDFEKCMLNSLAIFDEYLKVDKN